MQNPDQEARQIVRSLCQGTAAEQRRTLDRFFTPDFAFVHPFCAVPPFAERRVGFGGGDDRRWGVGVSSRDVVRCVFQWYRMLSPKIEIEVDSVLHDQARNKLFLDIRQTFSVWFIPAYHAHVRLVTILDLVPAYDDNQKHYHHQPANFHEPLDKLLSNNDDTHQETIKRHHSSSSSPSSPNNINTILTNSDSNNKSNSNGRKWLISRQEDLYQVNEFLRFAGPTPLPFLWSLFQLGATAVCVLMATLFLRLSPWFWGQKEPARAGVEAVIEVRDDERGEREDEKKGGLKTRTRQVGAESVNGDFDEDEDEDEQKNGGGNHGKNGSRGEVDGHGNGTNGHRRTSSTHSQPPKKPWKNGGSIKKR
ncbi:hypothetical protein BD289DRAFT_454598 [Coniella lustricola]|uniref:SigF-like NTF2-like domain-containing protein n=1 Tax=Coniella lustricola TaxID=2025994 RepID=A0A2T3A321_9PEZI|nr:hypothetical protein BD289DRAFT_454598 [Coniella lustricola]